MQNFKFGALGCAAIVASLSACAPPDPIVGGPCSYDEEKLAGTVVELSEDGALIAGADEEMTVPADYLREPLSVGDKVTVTRMTITKGTCTPIIYSVEKR